MNIEVATTAYEKWLSRYLQLNRAALEGENGKYDRMAASPFQFLRATFYRWSQLWPQVAPEAANAPRVLAVGDLHLENFGTWRDAEGRLAWGVNDFDEAAEMPYTVDLVRLATSARFAIRDADLTLRFEEACEAILSGYQRALERDHPRPFVLAERHAWLREIAYHRLAEAPEKGQAGSPDPFSAFWEKLDKLPKLAPDAPDLPAPARSALAASLPETGLEYELRRREAGLGSRGRTRICAVVPDWRGGILVREAKALAPSAWLWANGNPDDASIQSEAIATHAVRSPDPCLRFNGAWVVRRLAPDAQQIELNAFPRHRLEQMFEAMGHETANIHRGTRAIRPAILVDLDQRSKTNSQWLAGVAKRMADATEEDQKQWRLYWHSRRVG